MITIIDYGMGNLHSVFKAFRRIGSEIVVSSDIKEIEKADKLILPGVGHFKKGMENLINNGIDKVIKARVSEGVPLLGICLGMQLLTNFSEEGNVAGLGLIDAKTIHFKNLEIDEELKIPHIGWNSISSIKENSILENCNNEMFYFVHSYAVMCNNFEDILCITNYGTAFHSGFQKGNIIGVQFHPEKSHKAGLQLLRNFVIM